MLSLSDIVKQANKVVGKPAPQNDFRLICHYTPVYKTVFSTPWSRWSFYTRNIKTPPVFIWRIIVCEEAKRISASNSLSDSEADRAFNMLLAILLIYAKNSSTALFSPHRGNCDASNKEREATTLQAFSDYRRIQGYSSSHHTFFFLDLLGPFEIGIENWLCSDKKYNFKGGDCFVVFLFCFSRDD